jgi:hypothetical protein
MGIDDTHRLGYRRVDDDANVSVLLSTMDTTAAPSMSCGPNERFSGSPIRSLPSEKWCA